MKVIIDKYCTVKKSLSRHINGIYLHLNIFLKINQKPHQSQDAFGLHLSSEQSIYNVKLMKSKSQN